MAASDAEILARLQEPLLAPGEPEPFRLGIVLNGTVSAGAWTAGVLDFLIEAMDAWEEAKANQMDVPHHRVRLDLLGGASGGGVCAALFARAATCEFPPVRDKGGQQANPFWQVWVETLDIRRMLGLSDLANGKAVAASALDPKAIDLAAETLLRWGPGSTPGVAPRKTPRSWIGDPLRVQVTLTNLRGVPYRIDFAPSGSGAPRSSYSVDHADHATFAFPLTSGRSRQTLRLRDDEWLVEPDFAGARDAWATLALYAKATGAFPMGFPPRRLRRPAEHYRWRAAVLPGMAADAGHPARVVLRRPSWDVLPPADQPTGPEASYEFHCVDGGALNNQPVELVRTGLAGIGKSLERDGLQARATVLLIDPFAAAPECPAPTGPLDLLGVAGGLISAWKSHARHSTADLMLALDPEIYSRFLLTAGRKGQAGQTIWGGSAVAGAAFGAFAGFIAREFRVHDYLLGRKNCRDFLESHFVLPEGNPIFAGFAGTPAAAEYKGREPGTLQIIPLVASPARAPQPAWPFGMADPEMLADRVEARMRAVIGRLAEQHGIDIPCEDLVIGKIADEVAEAFTKALRKALASHELGDGPA